MKNIKTTKTTKSLLETLKEKNVQITSKEALTQIKGGIDWSEIDIR